MSKRTTTTAIALTGAVALASGAYAIGNQNDDGSALASGAATTTTPSDSGRHGDRGFGPGGRGDGRGIEALAEKLGVDSAKLETALREVRDEDKPGDRRTELAAALASALGIPTAKVTAAFDQLGTARRTAMAQALAKELGLSVAKVQSALAKVKPNGKPGERGGRDGDRGAKLSALAAELGVSQAKLRAALQKVRPDGPGPGGPGHRGPGDPGHRGPGGPGHRGPGGPGHRGPGGPGHRGPGGPGGAAASADLAKALGVTPAQLQAAMKKLRAAEQGRHAERRDAMAAALAKKLGIPEAKVKAALDSMPHHGGRGRHP